ncbi:GlcG/HbpS family heme-binding protein [Longivirga aurantiaca]|uniref:Heme-binding protein n=1 Tax=Longivirga aurantiaca TaxID=1837743 RepID=A0ABW1T2R0_9ACTN
MDLPQAQAALAAVVAHATTIGASVSCSVVDGAGNEVLTARMPGAPSFTPHIARTKARTAVALRMDSADVAGLAQTYPDLIPVIDEQMPFTVTTLAGGVLVRAGKAVLGAVGVSGATPDEDAECARAGASATGLTE